MSPNRESAAAPSAQPRSNFVELGVLVFAADGALEFAGADAIELLGCTDAAELAVRWPDLRESLERAQHPADSRAPFDVDVPAAGGARALRCELQHASGVRDGARLLVVRDRDATRERERERLDAARFHVHTRLQRAVEHELRDPLNALGLNLELLVDEVRAGVPVTASAQDCVHLLRREFHTFSAMLQAYLRRTQLAEDVSETFDLRALAGELAELLTAFAKQRRVAISLDVPARSIERTGLRGRIALALAIVAIELVDVLPAGGTLGVRVDERGRVQLRAEIANDAVLAALVERCTRAFTPHAAASSRALHVARSLVEGLGGRLVVRAAGARDIELTFELPDPEGPV